jgi:hypothetical protein
MKVITANLLVDFEGKRTSEFLKTNILLSSSPDIIMLQELHYKLKKKFDNYLVDYTPQFSLLKGMGCMIYVKNNHKVDDIFCKMFNKTFMDRGIYAVKVLDVWYITSHLESMDKPQFEKNRQDQLVEIWDFSKNKKKVVIGMDSNFKSDIIIPEMFKDVWSDEPISTWFSNRFFNYVSECRFDRFFVKNVEIIEKHKITNLFSDHDILYVDVL